MYSYTWDEETGGLLLNTTPLAFSKEPRPVYYEELDLLGFDKHWHYAKDDSYPYMWAEANNYYYRGRLVAKTKGGSLYTAPELILVEDPEPDGGMLRFVDVSSMVQKNKEIMDSLVQETIKKIYNTYADYKNRIDVFYVAFSGGKDSVVTLDLVKRALPNTAFKVLFGDTGMEFPDTYRFIDKIKSECEKNKIEFYVAKSNYSPKESWKLFGPPAVTIRWCCSVHKTTPQIQLLRKLVKKNIFRGMAFTGVRADESVIRSTYSAVNAGKKHRGQYSFHVILNWNSAELYNYILERKLELNESYFKGNDRVGCLVCPMSTGKHEFMKNACYGEYIDNFMNAIKETSIKNDGNFNIDQFIENGFWRTRKSGKELNFGHDKHFVEKTSDGLIATIEGNYKFLVEWIKTIGVIISYSDEKIVVEYGCKTYEIRINSSKSITTIKVENCCNTKNDIVFLSLLRSAIIKSVYCVMCGACAANCSYGALKITEDYINVSAECKHCHQCHDIFSSCLRYNSVKNTKGDLKKMAGLDRYFSFGIKEKAMTEYFLRKGDIEFWDSDGNGVVPNKQKDAFLNFLKDALMVIADKNFSNDKYKRYVPSEFAKCLFNLGIENETSWALMVANLVYTPQINWYVKNIDFNRNVSIEEIKMKLTDVMSGDSKGLGNRNVRDSIKMIMIKTPIGEKLGLGICDYMEKNDKVILKSLVRSPWLDPDPRVILYSLYKFAEACDGYYQFTVTYLMDTSIERNGISPSEVFGIAKDDLIKILNGLSVNYPEFISVKFTHDLDTIVLDSDKKALDVLQLF